MSYGEKLFGYGCVAVILTIILSLTWSNQATNEKITRMVEAGINPQSATCALTGSINNCILSGRN